MTRLLRLVPIACAALMAAALPSQGHAQAQPRHYDCSKPGNANKTVCKTAAPVAAAPAPASVTKVTTERHYDCSKAGNANKTVCKGAATTTVATAPTPSPASAPAPAPSVSRTTVTRTSATTTVPGGGNPTAKCRDGSVSYSAHRSGTCSHHGGVANWY